MWGPVETLWRDMFGLLAICTEARPTALRANTKGHLSGEWWGRLLKRASERRWVTALAESKRPARVAKMSEVQFSEARIEQVSEPSAGEA